MMGPKKGFLEQVSRTTSFEGKSKKARPRHTNYKPPNDVRKEDVGKGLIDLYQRLGSGPRKM
ncbi:hypothetical protein Cni_G10718 [Canna indica]|uniref:Uncharacterized protein n=1 Tax=Canna indica TaxID=4628 RepID=A0AAQ3K6C6_9LILI|nr:hypothetical protein Cni_G10718 [Canna indica]